MSETSEAIADIRKEAEARFRELLEKHVDSLGHIQAMQQFNQVFDRIEAARSCEVQSLQGTIVKLNDAIAEKQELNENSKRAQIEFCNAAKIREALENCANMGEQIDCQLGSSDATVYAFRHERSLAHNISECARAALAAPPRNCDRFDDELRADDLFAAFVKYCNDCDCPMGCIHRRETKGLLDVRCASILKCLARFALSKANGVKGVSGGSK